MRVAYGYHIQTKSSTCMRSYDANGYKWTQIKLKTEKQRSRQNHMCGISLPKNAKSNKHLWFWTSVMMLETQCPHGSLPYVPALPIWRNSAHSKNSFRPIHLQTPKQGNEPFRTHRMHPRAPMYFFMALANHNRYRIERRIALYYYIYF